MEQLKLFNEEQLKQRSVPFFSLDKVQQKRIIDSLRNRLIYNADLFYTPQEVGVILGISYYRVVYLIKFFRVDAVKLHTCLRIPAWSLLEYMEDYSRIKELEHAYYRWISGREVPVGFVA